MDEAANDWQEIINDDLGASWPCVVTNPSGVSQSLQCRFQDISQQVDPGTETIVMGRQVSLSITLSDLSAVGFSGIRGVEKKTEKPWKVVVDDILGNEKTYKVAETVPDASIGNMLIYLEPLQ